MRYKYYYSVPINSRLTDYLDTHQIRYQISGGGITPTFVIFTIWGNSASTPTLVKSLASLCSRDPIITVEFSKDELDQSKYLVIRPKKQSIEIINGKNAFSRSCTRVDAFGITRVGHEWQIGSLAIAKEPSMKTSTALWASDSGFAEIFADYRVYEMVQSNRMCGIEFKNVFLKNGMCSKRLYQVTSHNLIQREMIATGYGEKLQKCPTCGKDQFCIDSSYQLHLVDSDTIPYSDLYVTDRIFGDGIAEPLYIVSQRFYQMLKINNLAGSVTFSPVVLVSEYGFSR